MMSTSVFALGCSAKGDRGVAPYDVGQKVAYWREQRVVTERRRRTVLPPGYHTGTILAIEPSTEECLPSNVLIRLLSAG